MILLPCWKHSSADLPWCGKGWAAETPRHETLTERINPVSNWFPHSCCDLACHTTALSGWNLANDRSNHCNLHLFDISCVGPLFRASLQLKNEGMKEQIGIYIFVCNSRFSFVIFKARSRSSAMMFNQTRSVDTLCQSQRTLWRPTSSCRFCACKWPWWRCGQTIWNCLSSGCRFESHLRASMQKLSLPKMQVFKCLHTIWRHQHQHHKISHFSEVSFGEAPLFEAPMLHLPVCRSLLQKLTFLKWRQRRGPRRNILFCIKTSAKFEPVTFLVPSREKDFPDPFFYEMTFLWGHDF